MKIFNQGKFPEWESRTFTRFSKRTFWNFIKLSVWLLAYPRRKDLLPELVKLGKRIESLINYSGWSFTVSYLKECYRITSKTLAGDSPSIDLSGLRVGMRRGLPLIIPGSLRLLIEARDTAVIRIVLTVLAVFRVMPSYPKLKLETITNPFTGLSDRVPEITLVFQWFEALTSGNRGWEYFRQEITPYTVGRRLLRLTSAGPNHKLQVVGYPLDALAFKENPNLLKWYEVFAKNTNHKDLWERLVDDMKHWDSGSVLRPYHCSDKSTTEDLKSQWNFASTSSGLKLGRLALKMEAAGKVRVFAIVDAWTQSLLSPLHNALFDLLRSIEQDGTFNQLKPVMVLHEKGLKEMYSFDLSAATDRLPIALQTDVLSLLFKKEETALAWRNLLVERDYHLSDSRFPNQAGAYRYAVGQPMGALSSWAMLALTHHLLVQVAAFRVGFTSWFPDYAVLGDDIVIANKAVAQAYLSLMKVLGVEINLSKSLISSIGGCEFAKKVIVEGKDLSPLGVKELFQLLNQPGRLKDTIINYKLHDYIFADAAESVSVSETFISLLESMSSFTPKRWVERARTYLWDIIGLLGLNLVKGWTPVLADQAVSSLSDEDLSLLTSLIREELKDQVVLGWFTALGKDSRAYSKLKREFWNWYSSDFPSGDHLLGQYADDLYKTYTIRPDPDRLTDEELLEIAFSDMSRVTNPFSKPKASRISKAKSSQFERIMVHKIWQHSPHLFYKIMLGSKPGLFPATVATGGDSL